jgi:hypothetical protein
MDLQKAHIEKLLNLETEMKKHEQVEIGIKHYFAPGCYAREMFVPQGVMLTGKIHRFGHLNIMSKGKMTLVTETGRQVVEAPYTFISEPGAKRAFYAHEDSVWTTIHPTDETDLEKLENELLIPEQEIQKCLG